MPVNEKVWPNGPGKTSLDIRPGGPGNSWLILDVDGGIDAMSGGRQGVESNFGRNSRGQLTYKGSSRTGLPERWTGNIMAARKAINFLDGLLRDLDDVDACDCDDIVNPDVRVRSRCGDQRIMVGYDSAQYFIDVVSTSTGTDKPLSNSGVDNTDDQDVQEQESISAGLSFRLRKLKHQDISDANQAAEINQVVWRCGNEWWAVADPATTSPAVAPQIGYTLDNGDSWTWVDVNTFAAGNTADALVFSGQYVLVAGDSDGISYASIADIKNGVATPFAASSGISTETPNDIAVAEDGTVWAAGSNGYIWRSTDGGFSFNLVDAGVATSETLNSIGVAYENLVWFGGANGALVRYYNGTVEAVAVSGLSDGVNVVAVPEYRNDEVFLGTDGGDIYRSVNAADSAPTFTTPGFPGKGAGTIDDLEFIGWRGDHLYILQGSGSSTSRVLRDLSGGALGKDVEIVGSYSDPANSGFNYIAAKSINYALVVGEVHSGTGYIGRIVANKD